MKFLLDSNLCVAIMNGSAVQAATPLDKARNAGDGLYISTVVAHELWYGVAKSKKTRANAARLEDFLSDPFEVLAFDEGDARSAGEIRGELARRGTPIGPYDVLIAGQALARGMTLVTNNTREFERIDGLKLVDWMR